MIGAPERRRKPGHRLAWGLALLAVALLPLVPRLLATSEEVPSRAEAIYVFPGQVPERAECGARLYLDGIAPVVVFTGGQIAPELRAIEQPIPDASLNARIAHEQGVPRAAEVVIDHGSSTWEDALLLGTWMRRAGARQVIAVTSPTHSRRALYTLRAALGDLADEIRIYRCGALYGPLWWTQERSLVRVTLEALKLGFYSGRYFLPSALGLEPSASGSAHGP